MKHYKERKKLAIMDQALNQDMNVALEDHSNFQKKKKQQVAVKSKRKASSTVTNMFGRRLYAYFNHWKKHTFDMKTYSNTKLKDRIYSMYRARL